MLRLRMTVEYAGTEFVGWQVQPGRRSVQGEIEQALQTALRQPVEVIGSGRTDSGVHARGQVAHFDIASPPAGFAIHRLERSLNALTASDIAIHSLQETPKTFHARYSARSRHYVYSIVTKPTALQREFALYTPFVLDLNRFAKELESTRGRHDFAPFCVPRNDGRSTMCHVIEARLEPNDGVIRVHLGANRFLHKMVRSIVGVCIDVARGYHPPGTVEAIFSARFDGERLWAPPQGLCLERVVYEHAFS